MIMAFGKLRRRALASGATARPRVASQPAVPAGAAAELHAIGRKLAPAVTVMRPQQWVKSAFVGLPLFFTPSALSSSHVAMVALAMLCFCAASSGVYIINDLADRASDRAHPVKRTRPLAAGTLSVATAYAMMGALIAAGLGGAFALSPVFGLIVLAYLAINLLYSLALKHIAIVDVMLITAGFVLRIQAGAVVVGIEASEWIMLMTGLLALFLAFAKRRDDLTRSLGREHRRSLDGYTLGFVDTAQTVVASALLVGYLIYVTSPAVMTRLGTDHLFYTAPFVVFGILRYLQITIVENKSGSPVGILLTDWPMILTVASWLVTFAILIH